MRRWLLLLLAVGLLGLVQVPARASAAGADEESALIAAINSVRAENGLPVLAVDDQLEQIARYRSNDQVSRHDFSHTTPDGQTIFDVLIGAGVDYSIAGENLAESRGLDPVQWAISGFLSSQAHRDNLLGPEYNRIGVGAAQAGDGTTVLTVVFTD